MQWRLVREAHQQNSSQPEKIESIQFLSGHMLRCEQRDLHGFVQELTSKVKRMIDRPLQSKVKFDKDGSLANA